MTAPWWLCPNVPPCPHGAVLHDVEDYDDDTPRCCADGCDCGRRAAQGDRKLTATGDLMTPAEINDDVLDMARDMRREDWEESEPDIVERVEHLDISVIDIVWTAAWNAAVDACATGGQGTAAERIANLEAALRRFERMEADGGEFAVSRATEKEREACIALADRHGASYRVPGDDGAPQPFAALLRDRADWEGPGVTVEEMVAEAARYRESYQRGVAAERERIRRHSHASGEHPGSGKTYLCVDADLLGGDLS